MSGTNLKPAPLGDPIGVGREVLVGDLALQSSSNLQLTGGNVAIVLAQSAVKVTLTGVITQTELARIKVPGGMIGANGSLRVTILFGATNNANGKSVTARFGATAILGTTLASVASGQFMTIIRNRGSETSQVANSFSTPGFGTSSNIANTFSVDSSADQDFVIYGTLDNAADTITLEGYTVEVLPSA